MAGSYSGALPSVEPLSVDVARLLAPTQDVFALVISHGQFERAVGPFSEQECRDELRRLGVSPAAADARVARARVAPVIG